MLALSPSVPGSRDWLAHCGSLSKVMSPGLRVGWLIAPAELLAKANMCKQFSDAHTSNLSQAIAAEYLQMNRMGAALAKVRPAYAERAQALCANLKKVLGDGIEFSAPRGGMFVWARLTEPGADAREFAKQAIERGVAFIPGTPFFAVNPDHATLRFSFATADVAKIEEGVARLKA
jgi:DNA-binding transcriptional MocR family regulator